MEQDSQGTGVGWGKSDREEVKRGPEPQLVDLGAPRAADGGQWVGAREE